MNSVAAKIKHPFLMVLPTNYKLICNEEFLRQNCFKYVNGFKCFYHE